MPAYSPALSLVTAAFELAVAAHTARAPGRPAVRRLVVAILVLLAGYQLIEVAVCHDPADPFFARLAFADVVWLPPLGCALLLALAGGGRRVARAVVGTQATLAAFFSVWVFADPRFVTGSVCQAVIAFYTHPTNALEAYGVLYHLGLAGMMFGGIRLAVAAATPTDRAHAADLAMGTVGFVVPALLTEVVIPGTKNATPSLMCHYALVLAIFLARLARREQRAFTAAARAEAAPDVDVRRAPSG